MNTDTHYYYSTIMTATYGQPPLVTSYTTLLHKKKTLHNYSNKVLGILVFGLSVSCVYLGHRKPNNIYSSCYSILSGSHWAVAKGFLPSQCDGRAGLFPGALAAKKKEGAKVSFSMYSPAFKVQICSLFLYHL